MLQAPLVLRGANKATTAVTRFGASEPTEANLLRRAEVASQHASPSIVPPPNRLHITAQNDTTDHPGAGLHDTTDSAKLRPRVRSLHGRNHLVKRRLLVALALVGLLSAIPLAHAGAATQTTSDVTLIADPSVVVGTSTLTRTGSGLSFSLLTSRLEPGHAVTVWWMVANPDGGVAVLYAAGHVIDDSGTAEFGGYLQVGDSDGALPMGTDTTLEDALGATVFLVIRDHGPAKPGMVTAQIQTFDACNISCTDLQISVHQPPPS
jgi:hypothetical protein